MNFKKLILALCIGAILTPLAQAKNLVQYLDLQEQITHHATSVNSLYELLQYQQNAKINAKKLSSAIEQQQRENAMREYAYNLAIRTAITSQLSKAQEQVNANARNLDSIYNFEPLMIQGRVIPPVITEVRNLYNQNTPHQIRLSGAVYDIYSQARFSSTAPNWRDYLVFPNEKNAYELLAYGATGFEPKNDRERQVWVSATKKGWQAGVEQANDIIRLAMERLNRDYTGMVRFHTFVAQGKITLPIISSYQLHNTNLGERLILDEKLLQIQTLPTFNTPQDHTLRKVQGSLNYTVTQENLEPITSPDSQAPNADKVIANHLQGKPLTEPTFDTAERSAKAFYERPLVVKIDRQYIFNDTTSATADMNENTTLYPSAIKDTLGEPVRQENNEVGPNQSIDLKIAPSVIHEPTATNPTPHVDIEIPYWQSYKEENHDKNSH